MKNLSPRSSVRYAHLRVDSSGNIVDVWNWGDLGEVLNSINSGEFADRNGDKQDAPNWGSLQGIGNQGIVPRALADDLVLAGSFSGSFEENLVFICACHVDVEDVPHSARDYDELEARIIVDDYYDDLPPLEPPEIWQLQHDGVSYLPLIPRLQRLFSTPESASFMTLHDRHGVQDEYNSMSGLKKCDDGCKIHRDGISCDRGDPVDWLRRPMKKRIFDLCSNVLLLHLVVYKFGISETDHWHMF